MARLPGFIGPSYTSQSRVAADDQTVNWIPAKIESGTGSADYVFDPAPGFRTWCTLGSTPTRGSFSLNGASFGVGGSKLYQLPSTRGGSAVLRASGLSNINRALVTMASNGDAGHQIMIQADSKLYCFDVLTDTLTLIPDINASAVAFQDGYFIALDSDTSSIYLSALEDGTSWDPLDVAQRNDSPDKWVAMLTPPKELWLFGSQSTSVYYNNGDAGFPYVPNPSVAIARGTPAPASVALLENAPIWLADDLTVRLANGYTPVRVSTHAIEWAISQYTTIADADASTYQDQGHSFYVLNFPTANATWTYDKTTGMWHERGTWTGNGFDVSPVWGYTYGYNTHLVGDRTSGVVYEMTQDVATDTDGVTGLRRVRRAPHITQELKRTNYASLQLYMEVGLGLTSGQGSDPEAMLRWSDDGGQTWGNVFTEKVGAIGQFKRRVIWRMLGQGRDRVFELSVSDPIPWRLVDAFIDAKVGTS